MYSLIFALFYLYCMRTCLEHLPPLHRQTDRQTYKDLCPVPQTINKNEIDFYKVQYCNILCPLTTFSFNAGSARKLCGEVYTK